MALARRKYQNDPDGDRIRQFLRDSFLLNNRHEYNWPLYRWDYWHWHINKNIHHFDLGAAIFLWETTGQLAGVLNPDGSGEAFLQVHPRFRCPELEIEMMSTAETQYAVSQPDGSQKLIIWCPAGDGARQNILQRRGYFRQPGAETQHRRKMTQPIEAAPIPNGYILRPVGDADELPARSSLSWKTFHADEPDDRYQGWEWYLNVQRAPLYRPDLDLVAISPTGELSAFCTIWYDEITRTAAFEPVGAHPDHRRRGLGKALMIEGLRRAQQLGATLATVGSYSDPAAALYASIGFTDFDVNEPWEKQW